ncbi:MAG: hypothetical protein WC641_08210 [Patescibacteria group bacterium]
MHVRKEDLRKSKNAAAQQLRQLARSYTPHGAEDGGRVINRLLGLEHFPDLSLDDREKDRVMQYLDEMSQASGIAPEIFDTLISRMKHGGALDLMDLSGASDLIESGMEYSLVRDMLGVVALVWWFKVGQDLPSTDGKPLPSI